MKYSQFLTVFPLTPNASLLYSAYQDKFLVFKPQFNSIFEKMTPTDEVKLQYPDFYRQLVRAGALIPDKADEYKEIIESSRKYETESDFFHLIINPTLDCNFKCWYCYENHEAGSKMDSKVLGKIEKLISHKLNDESIQSFHLVFRRRAIDRV